MNNKQTTTRNNNSNNPPRQLTSSAGPRRSRRSTAGKRSSRRIQWSQFSKLWRRLFLDMGHCRLGKCIQKVRTNASDDDIAELRQHNLSFMATAISAASAYGATKEPLLLEYAHAVVHRGLNVNDCHNGDSALVLAAAKGYNRLAEFLLQQGAALVNDNSNNNFRNDGTYGSNPIVACVRSRNHALLTMLLQARPQQAAVLLKHRQMSWILSGAIAGHNVESVRILVSRSQQSAPNSSTLLSQLRLPVPTITDEYNLPHLPSRLCLVLREIYPGMQVEHWDRLCHWSFPTSDRRVLNLLWYTAASKGHFFPKEVWLHMFSFVGRYWFDTSSL